MSVTYGFYNSNNGDRKYDAVQISQVFSGLMSDGVIDNFMDSLKVTAGVGLSVIVGTGRAWFNDTWTLNDVPLNLSLETAEVAVDRKDAVVIRIDKKNRTNSILVLKGNPSTGIVTLGDDDHVLAYVTVLKNSTNIEITDMRNSELCGFVDFTGIDISRIREDTNKLIDELEEKIAGAESGAMYMPKTGGTFTGDIKAYSTNRTTTSLRNIVVKTASASGTAQSTNAIIMVRK